MSFFIKPENVSFLTDHLMAPMPRFGELASVFDTIQGSVKVIFGKTEYKRKSIYLWQLLRWMLYSFERSNC